MRESLHSHLLRSCCPVTGQPDWASVFIQYRGAKISRSALLQYLISFRNNQEFHEQCVERIFMDLMQRCRPEQLTVCALYAAWWHRYQSVAFHRAWQCAELAAGAAVAASVHRIRTNPDPAQRHAPVLLMKAGACRDGRYSCTATFCSTTGAGGTSAATAAPITSTASSGSSAPEFTASRVDAVTAAT